MKTKLDEMTPHKATEMASKRNCSELNDGDEMKRSVPTQVATQIDDFLFKIRENCQELIANAEQEAITIVTAAAQRTEAMKKELADLEEEKKRRMEAMGTEVEEEKKRRVEAMKVELADLEEEKKRIANSHSFGPMVKLDVGGQLFTTATATLTRFPDTMLGAMFSGRHALTQDKNGAYCIDRDGRHFHEILNFLRGSTASTQEQIAQRVSTAALEELKVEADFYGVKDLMFPLPDSVVIKSRAGYDSTVTQREEQVWYIQHSMQGGPTTPQIVKVCLHCGHGYITHGGCECWDDYPGFTTGRTISSAQPRPPGKCTSCKQ